MWFKQLFPNTVFLGVKIITSPPNTHTHFLLTSFFPQLNFSFWGCTADPTKFVVCLVQLTTWKISSNVLLGAPTWTSGGCLSAATFAWPGNHQPAVAQKLSSAGQAPAHTSLCDSNSYFPKRTVALQEVLLNYIFILQHPQLNVP